MAAYRTRAASLNKPLSRNQLTLRGSEVRWERAAGPFRGLKHRRVFRMSAAGFPDV